MAHGEAPESADDGLRGESRGEREPRGEHGGEDEPGTQLSMIMRAPGQGFLLSASVQVWGIFSVFPKSLRAQRAGRVAPRRGGAKRRAAALGAAQRRKAPPQAAERRAAHKACFSAFNFAPIIEKQKMLTGTSAGIRPVLQLRRSLGTELHGYTIK